MTVYAPLPSLRGRLMLAWHLLRGRPVMSGMAVMRGEIWVDAWHGTGHVHGRFEHVHWTVLMNPDRSRWRRLYGPPSQAGPADCSRALCARHQVHPQRRADGNWYCPMDDELVLEVNGA